MAIRFDKLSRNKYRKYFDDFAVLKVKRNVFNIKYFFFWNLSKNFCFRNFTKNLDFINMCIILTVNELLDQILIEFTKFVFQNLNEVI